MQSSTNPITTCKMMKYNEEGERVQCPYPVIEKNVIDFCTDHAKKCERQIVGEDGEIQECENLISPDENFCVKCAKW